MEHGCMKKMLAATIVTALTFTAVPHLVSAADPFEEYDEHVASDRVSDSLLNICREELGIDRNVLPVGARLFKLRRCINLKDASSNKPRRRTTLYRNRAKYDRVSGRIDTIENELTNRTTDILSKRFKRVRQDDRRSRTEQIRELLRRSRTERRVSLRQREFNESQEFLDRTRTIKHYRTECSNVPVAERRSCIFRQLHNLNLTTDRPD